jgi:hypothetical protein
MDLGRWVRRGKKDLRVSATAFAVGLLGLSMTSSDAAVRVVLVNNGQPRNGSDTLSATKGIVVRLVSDDGPIVSIDFSGPTNSTFFPHNGFFGHIVQRGYDPTGQFGFQFGVPGTTNPGPESADNRTPSVWNLDSHFLPVPGATYVAPPAEGNGSFLSTPEKDWPMPNPFVSYGLGYGFDAKLTASLDLSAQPQTQVDLAYISVWAYDGPYWVGYGPVGYTGIVHTTGGSHILDGRLSVLVAPEPCALASLLFVWLFLTRHVVR